MSNNFWEKIVFIIKARKVRLPIIRKPSITTPEMANVETPKLGSLKLPKFAGFNLKGKTAWIIAGALTGSTAILSLAIWFSIDGIEQAPIFPSPAIYDLAETQQLGYTELSVGQKPAQPLETQTLQMNIGGARISEMIFKDMDIGAESGITWALQIDNTDGTGAKILCENLMLLNVTAPKLRFNSSTAYISHTSSTVADGFSINQTLSSVPVDYVFGSTRGALKVPEASGGTVDRIVISTGSSTSTVGTIWFEDIRVHGGGIDLQDVACGTVTIKNSTIGDGTGIDSASFVIGSSVKASSVTNVGNTEKPVSVK